MPLFGCLNKIIMGNIQTDSHVTKGLSIPLSEFSDCYPFAFSGLLHLLSMFIRTGHKEYIFPVKPLKSCKSIRCNQFIGMTNMRFRIRIRNGCCYIKSFPVIHYTSNSPKKFLSLSIIPL
ncbi:hypothetical protein B488_08010 [Liberibacter crescens BT-1]|uniref:Uncharacterized protein n=1 Tax=Liberibacter crescens (strain BT-1) TaxID=1215343 RepID=L0EVU2_LIBCB|nr:hypothetical protein B488_08010 [Liberibacter crescens BT-1]